MTARIFALFVALLTIMNLLGDLLWPGFDASIWWISLDVLPGWMSQFLLAVSAFTLLGFAFRRPARGFQAEIICLAAFTSASASTVVPTVIRK